MASQIPEEEPEDNGRRQKQLSLNAMPHPSLGAPPTRHRHHRHHNEDDDMIGPLLRRKKVVSLPLGGDPRRAEFFYGVPHSPPEHEQRRARQYSGGTLPHHGAETPPSPHQPRRVRQGSAAFKMNAILRRKQVSLDLLAPQAAEFFAPSQDEVEEEVGAADAMALSEAPEGVDIEEIKEAEKSDTKPQEEEKKEEVKLFKPLQFSPRVMMVRGEGGGGHGGHGVGHGGGGAQKPEMDDATRQALVDQGKQQQELARQVTELVSKLEPDGKYQTLVEDIRKKQTEVDSHARALQTKLLDSKSSRMVTDASTEEGSQAEDSFDDSHILKATRKDFILTGILFVIMVALTGLVVGWDSHLDETFSTFGPVGLACATPCAGNLESQDYFHGHSHLKHGDFIRLVMNLDPNPDSEAHAIVEIVGEETHQVKASIPFGPPDHDEPVHEEHQIEVDFDRLDEEHIINVRSDNGNTTLTYTLHASNLSPMAGHSELIAALIMVFVYLFILLEVIHRTLVAIFGSMVALFFFFLIHEGETESIRTLMLHMEWSTLGLLFGMMLLVGELSHTGIFEWFSVRLLVASKGSWNRLMVLLCLLTAVASAFLDNVTTMLLVAPVTIDMCNILSVDPRPYLIGEVILSNIGGTATLIGDPPNIIIGSAFDEIGFVDFIINIAPCVFFFLIPVSIGVVLVIYRYYMTATKMPELDSDKLKRTYQVYDEPRLLIAGTVMFFVILMFFLHPVHHKDTAWIALLGALVTIAFTNPHDVQDALRNHVEWDTLLFFAGLFVLVEVCADMGLLEAIGDALAKYIEAQPEGKQLTVAITLIIWVSAITSAFLDNIPYTATMIPVIRILSDQLPDTLPIETLAWALSFGACLGGNGTLLGASANIVTAGISTNKGFEVSFLNFLYPGIVTMIATVAIANLYMLIVFVWV